MSLPLHTILQGFGHLDNPPKDVPCIALVCSRCTTVENYSAEDRTEAVVSETGPSWVVVEWLGCEKENCGSPLPLFAELNSTSALERGTPDSKNWRWKSLHCQNGHTV